MVLLFSDIFSGKWLVFRSLKTAVFLLNLYSIILYMFCSNRIDLKLLVIDSELNFKVHLSIGQVQLKFKIEQKCHTRYYLIKKIISLALKSDICCIC